MHYAVVAALDPGLPAPLGPFLPKNVKRLKDNDIVLVDWKGTPLSPGRIQGRLKVTYYGAEEQETPITSSLRLRGWIPLRGAADDPDLTPEFPGITDKASLDDWNPPASLHYQKKRVTAADEEYWKNYRTTPKAYVNLATGEKLWGSRFGKLTSIRLAGPERGLGEQDLNPKTAAQTFENHLLKALNPEEGGLVFEDIRERAELASAGSSDFRMLFLGFSGFIIVAALLLVSLLFRLNFDRRAAEIGVLVATGIDRGTVRQLLLCEGSILAGAGAVVGCAGAGFYAWLLLEYLRSWWPGGLERSFLHLEGTVLSYLIGFGIAFLMSLLAIAWAIRGLGRVAPRALLAGSTSDETDAMTGGRPGRWWRWAAVGTLAGGLACAMAGGFIRDHEIRASTFLGSGFLLLTAGLVCLWGYLRRQETSPSRNVATLGVRNASRHPVRSLLTVGLLAAAAFLIIAVESFHKDPARDFDERRGGSGGFSLVAESEVSLFQSLQSPEGRADLAYVIKLARLPAASQAVLQGVSFQSFRLRGGDDASCLNLAQPLQPRLLGVSRSFIENRGGFRFANSLASTPREQENPWLLLAKHDRGQAIPVIADATTVEWTLHSGLGKTLNVRTGNGEKVDLRIVGLLEDSIFQSELLMSDRNFRRLYPHQEGYNFFLIDAPRERMTEVKNVLEAALAGHGFTVTPAIERLKAYLAVENTYLATFQVLGGLGLLLGALGLAVVLLRSVWERRGELALLRALGYRRSALGWLVLAENGFLLILGLGIGMVAALGAVFPHLLAGSGEVPLLRLLGLLALVLLVGLAAGAAAVASMLRAPLLPALRRE
jgi:ABC-type antimicrobial peptide transport system permease subunit